MREEGVILKNHADASPLGHYTEVGAGDRNSVNPNLTFGDGLESGDAAQQGRFATAGRAKQAGDAAGINTKADAIDDGVRSVALNDAVKFEMSHQENLETGAG
ncbi:conserved hypothetical protein [Candidatus Propionivibrio aalborgensis]|uniref:Uncharacterized protein n=1 Tax=Candidatus Propionivibrio aalborgensis TaxID=1860101 RepID=A0A1A8XGR3_9RHOO|nr:conserved hypothetical protein [Candidatus Propionivibrio aalborgensis]